MRKKVFCLLLSLCVLISMFPMVALADTDDVNITIASDGSVSGLPTGCTWGGLSDKTLTIDGCTDITSLEVELGAANDSSQTFKLVVNTDCSIGKLDYKKNSSKLVIQGSGALTIGEIRGFDGEYTEIESEYPSLEIAEGARVVINNNLYILGYDSNGGHLYVNGSLEVNASDELTSGVTVGFSEIGVSGSLTINAPKAGSGLLSHGEKKKNGEYNFKDILVIKQGGTIDIKTSDGVAMCVYRSYIYENDNPDLTSAFDIPDGYLGTTYATVLNKLADDAQVELMSAVAGRNGERGTTSYHIEGGITEYSDKSSYPAEVKLPAEDDGTELTPTGGHSKSEWCSVITEDSIGGSVELTGDFVRIASNAYARKGKELTLTPEPADGYTLKALYINDEPAGQTPYVFTISEDVKVKAEFEKTQTQLIKEAREYASSIKLIAKSKLVTTANGKKAVKVYWYDKNGKTLSFDGYEIYRSVKKSSYGKKPIFTTNKTQYLNTAVKKGTRYYYKVRAYKQIADIKLYSDLSTQAWRRVK